MKPDINPYEILGVSKDATKAEIKKAYKNRAKQIHPDKMSAEARKQPEIQELIRDLNEAKTILLNDKKRKLYDELEIIDQNNHEREERILLIQVIMNVMQEESVTVDNFVLNVKNILKREFEKASEEFDKIQSRIGVIETIVSEKYRGMDDRIEIKLASMEANKGLKIKRYQLEKQIEVLNNCIKKADSFFDKGDSHVFSPFGQPQFINPITQTTETSW